jgi:hypothetical protein
MSVQSAQGHYQTSTVFSAPTNYTYLALFYINSDLGTASDPAGTQILLSRNYDGSVTGEVFYWDGGDNNAYVANFVSGAANAATALASRPPLNTWCAAVLQCQGEGANDQIARWLNIEDPSAGWISATCQSLTAAQWETQNNQSTTSNSRPTDSRCAHWRAWSRVLTVEDLYREVANMWAVMRDDLDWDVPMYSTSAIEDYSPNRVTIVTQGGTLSDGNQPSLNDLIHPGGYDSFISLAAPQVTSHPSPQSVESGATASFSITATGATSYQWQRQPPEGGSYSNVSGGTGGTTANYTTPTLARSDSGAQYRCQATNALGTSDSLPGSLSVSEVPTSYSTAVGLVVGSSSSPIGFSYVGSDDAGSGVSGTLATTNADDTLAASGTTTVTGTLARTNADDTSAASGTTTVTGSLAYTNANDTLAASGSVGSPVDGDLATTNADDSLAASGTTTVIGTLATTNAADTLSASGTTTVTGASATTNADDSLAASGASGSDVTGSLATTNANDSLAASGTTTVVGSSSATNADDTLSSSGTTTVVGTSATTNADDSLSASGSADSVVGTLAYTNANDVLAAFGIHPVPSRGGGKPRRNYIYKGKRYHVTLDELMRMIRADIDVSREDIKVVYKSKKPHPVSKNAWAELQATIKSLDSVIPVEDNDDEDIEALLTLL